jgi:hypothetical protein
MTVSAAFYVIFVLMVLWTLRFLPFINVDAATWFQLKMMEFMRWLDQHDK